MDRAAPLPQVPAVSAVREAYMPPRGLPGNANLGDGADPKLREPAPVQTLGFDPVCRHVIMSA
jgi:hypothetical protein